MQRFLQVLSSCGTSEHRFALFTYLVQLEDIPHVQTTLLRYIT